MKKFDVSAWLFQCDKLSREANVGCGISYELYQRRLSLLIDNHLNALPNEHYDQAAKIARQEFGYMIHEKIERNCSSTDCGDINDDFGLDEIDENTLESEAYDADVFSEMYLNVFTSLDAHVYLAKVEGDLMAIRAIQLLGVIVPECDDSLCEYAHNIEILAKNSLRKSQNFLRLLQSTQILCDELIRKLKLQPTYF
ncbi:hypothetical protein ABLA30_03875 [Xenorhabdus nematophila]|uniref:hypothetical protein n=1 Tax=Xenorhabdus nematophila TaxID=628 RepID=UPI0032B74B39